MTAPASRPPGCPMDGDAIAQLLDWCHRKPNRQYAYDECRYCGQTWWSNPGRPQHRFDCIVDKAKEQLRAAISAARLPERGALPAKDVHLPSLPAFLSADEVNGLPARVKDYIRDIETLCDPAGIVRENAIARDTIKALEARIAELTTPPSPAFPEGAAGSGDEMLMCHLRETADNACECEPGFMCVPHMAVVHARELIARVNAPAAPPRVEIPEPYAQARADIVSLAQEVEGACGMLRPNAIINMTMAYCRQHARVVT